MAGKQIETDRQTAVTAPSTLRRRGLIAGAAALVAALAVRGGADSEHVAADGAAWSMPYSSGTQNMAGVLAGLYNNGTGTALTGSSYGYGVLGNTNAVTTSQYAGVYGIGNGGSTYGVYGYGLTTGTGVLGVSGNSIGVNGQSTGGTGVTGQSTSGAGVRGYSGSSYGVFASSGYGTGVYGLAADSGNGVYGISQNFHGVSGSTNASPGSPSVYPTAGVFGFASNDNTAGVTGSNLGGVGVSGYSSVNTGVVGRSDTGIGVFGAHTGTGGNGSPYGVVGSVSGIGIGVYGVVYTAGAVAFAGGAGVSGAIAAQFSGPMNIYHTGGTTNGNLFIQGNYTAGGTKSAAVPHPDGSHRLLYCMESPEAWFEDFGEGTITAGKAEVKLDPDFAAVVDTSKLHVFLTKHDATHDLSLTGRSATGFTVSGNPSAVGAAMGKKASDLSGTFSFRVVAKRKDVTAGRLAKYELPQAVKTAPLPANPPTPKDVQKPTAVPVPPPPPAPPKPDKQG